MKVHRPGPDVAAAGKRNDGSTAPGQERAQDTEACSHPPHLSVPRVKGTRIDRRQGEDAASVAPDRHSQTAENRGKGLHVVKIGYPKKANRLLGENSRGHDRKRGVLGTTDLNRACQPSASADRQVAKGAASDRPVRTGAVKGKPLVRHIDPSLPAISIA